MRMYSPKNMYFTFFNFNLSINDSVAAEGKYHAICQSGFENPVLKYKLRG